MDDTERTKLPTSMVAVQYLHLEEARRYAPDNITAADLPNLVGPISNRVQNDVPWSKAIEQAVKEYVGPIPSPSDEALPEDPDIEGSYGGTD